MTTLRRIFALALIVSAVFAGPDFFGTLTGSTTKGVQAAAARPSTARPPRVGRAAVAAKNDWLQFDGNSRHSGDSPQESIISTANVGSLSQLFQVGLPAVADGAPVYLSQVATSSGTRDLIFVTTKAGDIVALDAHTGAQIWSQSNPAGSCLINNGSTPCYTTSSPALDPNRQYVYSYGLDGKVHKYAVGTGSEVFGNGWPELATLKGFDEKESPALSIVTVRSGVTYLYVANGGYPGDEGDYQGHLTAINLSTGAQKVFNANCSNQTVHFVETPGSSDCSAIQSAIWARPGTIYDATLDRILLVTGNGPFSPSAFDWGDTVFSLNPDGTGAGGNPLDSYTPTNYQALDAGDQDVGSTAPAILATPGNCSLGRIVVQSGKDGLLRLLNLDNLSGQGGPGHTGGELGIMGVPQTGEVLTQPATWVNPADGSSWVFVANDSGISGLQLVANVTSGVRTAALLTKWTQQQGGSSPIVANNVLYYASGGTIQALNPTTGRTLWQSAIGGIHWESPIVVNGVLYITDENGNLTAYTPSVQSSSMESAGVSIIYLPVVVNTFDSC